MSGEDSVDFEVDLNGNTAVVAKKMAAEVARLEAQFEALSKAHTKVERSFARSVAFSPQQWKNLSNHAQHLERAKRAYTSMAPASAAAARGLRTFGVSGGFLRKFTIDAAKSEIALRRLYRLKGGGFSGAGAVAGSVMRRGASKYGGAIGSAALSGAATIGGAAATGGLLLGAAAMGGVGLLGVNMASTAIEAERVKFALDRVTNGAGASWWSTASQYAKDFGLNVNMTADALMKMKASGFTDEMSKDMFLRMGDLRAIGAGEGEIDRALLAIRQIKSIGRLMGEELNQLTEAGVDAQYVYDALGRKLGKTTPELIRMKEAGELTSDLVLPAISEAIGIKTKSPVAGQAGAAAAGQTVSGQWGRLKGAWSVASADALDSEMLTPLRTALGSFTAWISGSGGQAAIGGFGNVIGKVFEKAPAFIERVIWLLDEGLPAAWAGFSEGFASTGAGEALTALSDGFADIGGDNGERAKTSLNSLGASMGSLAGSLATLVGWIGTGISYLTSFGEAASWLTSILPGGQIGTMFQAFGQAGDTSVGDALAETPIAESMRVGFTGIGSDMATGLANGLASGNPAVSFAAANLGAAAEQALREQQQVHSPGRKMMAIGRFDAEGYAVGVEESLPRVESAAAGLGNAATRGASSSGGTSVGGGITVQVYINGQDVTGQSDAEKGDTIGEAAAHAILRRLAYAGAA